MTYSQFNMKKTHQFCGTGKLIYCTRTVPEMVKCMEEIRRVIAYRVSLLGPEGGKVN